MDDREGLGTEGRAGRALRAGLLGLGAGGVLGAADALRALLETGSVLPPSLAPAVVLLYAGCVALPGAAAGALLSPPAAAAGTLAGTAALGAGLVANVYLLPGFTDPLSLAGDAVVLLLAAAAGGVLLRRFRAGGPPGPRGGPIAFGAALAAGLLAALLLPGRDDGPAPTARRAGEGPAPDVVLVVVDTLRADAVGFSGSPLAAGTPRLDALAAGSAVFTRCRAPSSWTKPSTATILTGLEPAEHGASSFEGVLPGSAATLAEILRAAGYRTAAFTDNPFVSPEFGFAQGFGEWLGRHPDPLARGTLLLRALSQVRLRLEGGPAATFGPGVDLGASRLVGEAVSFLAAPGEERPAFAYLHLIEPHYPYTPPPPRDGGRPRVDPPHAALTLPFDRFPPLPAADAAAMRANYLGEVGAADEALGRLFDALRREGRLERTVVVVTSDHGEEFYEHGGWTHGQSLYEELVRVPLLVRAPGGAPGAGRRIDAPVVLADLVPTVLELAGVAAGPRFSGRSLLPLLRGEEGPAERAVLAELALGPVGARAIFAGPLALVVSRKAGEEVAELFDLSRDPGQAANLLAAPDAAARARAGEAAAALRRSLEEAFRRMEAGSLGREERPFDEETRRALKALGYL